MKLQLYYWKPCPHCRMAMEYLDRHSIPYDAVDVEKTDGELLKKIIEVNGGKDWVVPTLCYEGKWSPGRSFSETAFAAELKKLGVSV